MLKNKIVVVTGGGSGIGKSIAKLFSENNAIVCVTDKNLESAEKTAEECVNKSLFYKLDVTNKSEIQKVFKTINNTIGWYPVSQRNKQFSVRLCHLSSMHLRNLPILEWLLVGILC